MAFCSNCGASVAEKTAFCSGYGSAISAGEQQGITDKDTAATYNKVLIVIWVGSLALTVIGYGGAAVVLPILLLPYILFKLSKSLGAAGNKPITFGILGAIPMVNFAASIYLNIKTGKLIKSNQAIN